MELRTFGLCPQCNQHHRLTAPCDRKQWEIWCIDDDETREDAVIYTAVDAETAAELWAEDYDTGDYPIVGQNATPTIHVSENDTDKIYIIMVSGEATAAYYPRLITSPDPEEDK